MFCCSISWLIATALCIIFIPIVLLLYFTGNIAILPEVTKLLVVAAWCYLEALFNLLAPRKRKSIEGLTAVVTGSGHGIGREIALGLAKKGKTIKCKFSLKEYGVIVYSMLFVWRTRI